MQLKQYPQAIACLEETYLQCSLDMEIYQEALSFLDAEIELMICNDGSLKNEQMRKARRLHYQQQPDYLDMKNRYKEARIKRERTGIELTRVKNQFSIFKLEARQAIASLEAAS